MTDKCLYRGCIAQHQWPSHKSLNMIFESEKLTASPPESVPKASDYLAWGN